MNRYMLGDVEVTNDYEFTSYILMETMQISGLENNYEQLYIDSNFIETKYSDFIRRHKTFYSLWAYGTRHRKNVNVE
jgi:hypothetical protein